MSEYRDVEILGVGKEPGGRFGRVLIAGSGKLVGPVECESFELPGAGKVEEGSLTVHGPLRCFGAGKVEGAVRAASMELSGSFKAEGSCTLEGDLELAGSLKVEGPCTVGGKSKLSGSMKVEGPCTLQGEADVQGVLKAEEALQTGLLNVTGELKAEAGLRAETIESAGVLKVEGNVQAERFRASGPVEINGELNAEQVELELVSESAIESIVGGSVKVRKRSEASGFRRGLNFRVRFDRERGGLQIEAGRPHLAAGLIEADEVDLEFTDCETVRGVNVHIGRECVVDRVEYSGTLSTDAYATVGEKVKV